MRYLLILSLFLFSCSVERKLQKAEAILEKHPEVLAELCAEKFPPKVTEGRVDTVYPAPILIKGDSIPCPDGTKVKAPDVIHRCPPSTHRRDTIINTAEVEKFKLFLKSAEIDKGFLNGQLQEKEKSLSESRKEVKKYMYSVVCLGLLALLLLLYIIYGKLRPRILG